MKETLIWLLAHIVCHSYAFFQAGFRFPEWLMMLIVFLIQLGMFANIRLSKPMANVGGSSSDQFLFDGGNEDEIRSTEMGIEGPPRIPLRSAICTEMGGRIILRSEYQGPCSDVPCLKVGKCRFDHYSPWIGTAIGAHNHRQFVLFLLLYAIDLAYCR